MTPIASRLISALIPIALAIGLCSVLFTVSGYNVSEILLGSLEGAVTGVGGLAQTFRWATPLCVIALGVVVSLRAGEFNIGAQGQLMMGSLATVAVALLVPLPAPLALPLALLSGAVAGALWSGLAGAMKLLFAADEVISTLMLNFIAALIVSYVASGPLTDPGLRGDSASTPAVSDLLRLSDGTGASIGILGLTGAVVLAVWLLAERTTFGLQSRLVGANPVSAEWQGISTGRLRAWTYLIAGATSGLAGAMEVLGPTGRVITGATPSIGFTAIVVALVAQNRVLGVVAAALFFGSLQAAVNFLPIVSDLPPSGLQILEGIVAMLVTAQIIFVRRRKA